MRPAPARWHMLSRDRRQPFQQSVCMPLPCSWNRQRTQAGWIASASFCSARHRNWSGSREHCWRRDGCDDRTPSIPREKSSMNREMQDFSQHDRTMLGDRLRHLKPQVAEQVTEVFLERHPDWLLKYGERARKFGIEDAQFHIDFLRGAVEANSIQAFED